MAKSYDTLLRLLFVGNTGVGKTCLIHQYACNEFQENYRTTIGVDFKMKVINLDGINVKLQIWDTAGQERFESITKQSFTRAQGFALVYDICCRKSFESLAKWLLMVKLHAREDPSIIIIGNKSDCEEERQVLTTTAQQFADQNNVKFYETSAKDPESLKQPFEALCRDIIRARSRTPSTDSENVDLSVPHIDLSKNSKSVQTEDAATNTSGKKCC